MNWSKNGGIFLCALWSGCSAYDRAAIKFRGVDADINFSLEDYQDDLKQVSANSNLIALSQY